MTNRNNPLPKTVADLPLLKRGSVKNLRGPLPSGEIVFEFTDDFSVFDWGKMPDAVPEKGRSLLRLASHFFRDLGHPVSWREFFATEKAKQAMSLLSSDRTNSAAALKAELESIGMRSCYRGLYPEGSTPLTAEGVRVERLEIIEPIRLSKEAAQKRGSAYDYDLPNNSADRVDPRGALIPLEVVFRHGLTNNSSYFERNPETPLKQGDRFPSPLIEFFTKLEPSDRFIATESEALIVGRLSPPRLIEIRLRSILLSLWLEHTCAVRDLELVDGKFEWGLDAEGRMILADAIGPDELRLMELRGSAKNPERLSKEFLREYYRDSKWFAEITELKKKALAPGWQKTIRQPVPHLPTEGLQKATSLYRKLERRFRPENVLLFGSGGREHALARKLLESANLSTLHWAPGQDAAVVQLEAMLKAGPLKGGARKRIVRWKDAPWNSQQTEKLISLARDHAITLVIFSQDADLASGAADHFRDAGFPVFGPSMQSSRIEWSKSFAKEICKSAGVPSPKSFSVQGIPAASAQLGSLAWTDEVQWVLKADGLALGKGVVVAQSKEEAIAALPDLARFGNAFLIEERVKGVESSWFAFADGETFSLLDPARDYKRLGENQTGPNTGGMGSVSPLPEFNSELRERIRSEVFTPIFAELKRRGVKYQGLLYAGLMIDGESLNVLEFNARFGDPETQALLPRMQGDLLEWMGAIAGGTLVDYPRDVPFTDDFAVYVVAAASGYPVNPNLGETTPFTESLISKDDYRFAGLTEKSGHFVVSGGRVFGALGRGNTVGAARADAYAKLELGLFPGAQFRKDIGL
ncbi:MAG: phosphoribosylamine--glycine ligase [Cryobacterium sp.]|nr:phosphoribosylamine--glycine ligase [Oligoflexia bacterium]